MKIKKFVILPALILLMTEILLVSCKNDGSASKESQNRNDTSTQASIDKNLIYSEKNLELKDFEYPIEDISYVSELNGEVLAAGTHYENDAEGNFISKKLFYSKISVDKKETKTYVLEDASENEYFAETVFDGEGSLYTIKAKNNKAADYGDYDKFSDALDSTKPSVSTDDKNDEESDTEYLLLKYDNNGTKIFEVGLEFEELEEGGINGVNEIHYIENIGIAVCDYNGISIYSETDGSFIKRAYQADYPEIMISGEGKTYLRNSYDEISEIDLETGTEVEKIPLTQDVSRNIYGMKRGGSFDFIAVDENGISGWNVKDGHITQIVDFIDSDIDTSYTRALAQIDDESFVMISEKVDMKGEYTNKISILTKVPAEEVVEKTVISIGVMYINRYLRGMIVYFNKSNPKYRIKVVNYSKYETEEDFYAGRAKLNSDIIAGTAPDIIMLDSFNNMSNYASKGVLEKLDSYMENDEEISSKEYLTKIFDAFRYKGDMYLLTPSFSIQSYVIKAEAEKNIDVWNIEALEKLINEGNSGYTTAFGFPVNKQQIINYAMISDISEYIDIDNNEAKFDTPQFISLLDFANKFPKEIDDEMYMDDISAYYRNGKAVIAQIYLDDFESFSEVKYGVFGSDVSIVGFPREDGKYTSSITSDIMLAMSSSSKNKEGAWEFMRLYLLDEFQSYMMSSGGFPVEMAKLRKMASESMEKTYYIDDITKDKLENRRTYTIGGEEIEIPPLTKEDTEQIFKMFDTVNSFVTYDEKMMTILEEELEPFFEGQKSAEECAHIIQSKMQIYLDESR